MTKIFMKILLVAMLSVTARSATALTIDTTSGGNHYVNNGHVRSGQSLTVDATENVFNSIGFLFGSASNGRTFDLSVSDALNGGTTLFSTSFVVTSGLNVININQAMTPGSLIYVFIDYNGHTAQTALLTDNIYAGGSSLFGHPSLSWSAEPLLDHRFVAEFSGGDSAVPLPAALPLFATGLGVMGLLGWRRKRKAQATA